MGWKGRLGERIEACSTSSWQPVRQPGVFLGIERPDWALLASLRPAGAAVLPCYASSVIGRGMAGVLFFV